MSIFWNVIELTATAFESYIIVSAITAIFGHRYAENKGKIIDILFMMAATGYVTLLNHFDKCVSDDVYVYGTWNSGYGDFY